MKVQLDSEVCRGHLRCHVAVPDLFDSDDYGYAVLIGDGQVPPGLESAARLAAANCPERAITVED
jgi:ferredoxin